MVSPRSEPIDVFEACLALETSYDRIHKNIFSGILFSKRPAGMNED